jgi:hypothetical protein
MNTYGYVGDNPLTFIDPAGRQGIPIGADWYERREYIRQMLRREAERYVDATPGAASQVALDAGQLVLLVSSLDPKVKATGAFCKEAVEQLLKRPATKRLICTTVRIFCTLFTQGPDKAASVSRAVLKDIRRVEQIERRVVIENAPKTVQLPK